MNQQNLPSALASSLGVSGHPPVAAGEKDFFSGSRADPPAESVLNLGRPALPPALDFAREVNGTPDAGSIVEALADRLRMLLHTSLVCVLLRRDGPFELRAVSAENPELGRSARMRHDRQTLRFAADLAQRAVNAGEPISLSIGADVHSLGNLVPAGMLIAAPFRTSSTQGAVLIYPRPDGVFTADERALVAAISGFAAVALAHAELHAASEAQARELRQSSDKNQHLSEQQRLRDRAIAELAGDTAGSLSSPDFTRHFLGRIAELTGSRSVILAVPQESQWRVAAVHPPVPPLKTSSALRAGEASSKLQLEAAASTAETGESKPPDLLADRDLERSMGKALAGYLAEHPEQVRSDHATEVLGKEAAEKLGWSHCACVRLRGVSTELAGILCLSRVSSELKAEDRALLEEIAARAGLALENSRAFLRIDQANRNWLTMFDAITDFIVVHDQADKVLRVNRSLAAMIGVPAAELVGVNMRALMAFSSEMGAYSCPFCRSTEDHSGELAHSVFDRTYFVSTSRVHGDGDGVQTVHVLKDISDRREAERRYRELFDNIQEGLFFSTPAGRFIEVNDAMVRMLGYGSREELLQIDIPTQLYSSAEQRFQYDHAMNEQGALRNVEATFRRKDGTRIHVLINAFGLYDSAGKILQVRGLMLDITGLRTYQSELHRERDFSGKILSNTQSLILVADTAGLISYANRRWFDAGFEQGELLGRPLVELAAPSFTRALAEAVQSTLDGQPIDNLELEIVRQSGAIGKFSANLSPMRDEQGNVTSIVLVLTDITDSAVLRDKLVHAEKMAAVGQLVSGVAHEVNNPLTAILGFADLLMDNPDLPETARKDLRVILQEAQRTKQIVQNLLSFARQMPPQRNPVQLNSILRRTIQLRSYDFNSHGVEVIEHLDEDLPDVIGDAHQLQQVFLNILNNAYDAVHEVKSPARIEIMTTKSGDGVEISFADNGKGVSHPDRIFDPFFTTKEVGKGTGLGLSICYGIVKEHGGEILCHNNIAGQGATFIVRLPAASHTVKVGVAAGANQP